jgi:uncharacterized membrane protein YadS
LEIIKTKSFRLAAIMTLTCSLAGILLAKLPYANLIGALVLALLLGILMQFLPERTRQEASGGMGFISNKFLRLGMILLGFRLDLEKLGSSRYQNHLSCCTCSCRYYFINLLAQP